jgi:transcriptional regulator with XRE-family HTH domain
MTPNQIIRKTRREREMSGEELAEVLGLTRARLSQYENGDPIPPERVQAWLDNKQLPDWARTMCLQIWHASIEQQHQTLSDQINALGDLLQRDILIDADQTPRPPRAVKPVVRLDTIPGLHKGVSA